MTFPEKMASLSWTFLLSLVAIQVVLTAVIHRLRHGAWDGELVLYSGLGAVVAMILVRLWGQRTRNRPST